MDYTNGYSNILGTALNEAIIQNLQPISFHAFTERGHS